MFNDLRVGNSELKDETGNIWELGYYVRTFNEEQGQVVYGLKIERSDADNQKMSESTCGLTSSYEEAEGIAMQLLEGTVTPMSLHAVVDDLF